MAATNYTPISLYYSATTTNVPTAGNLVAGELALNTADGKLFYKDSSGVVQTLASKSTGTIGGSTTQVQYNSSGSFAGSANMIFDGSTLTTLNTAYTGTLTGGTGIINLGSGQFYKDASGNFGLNTTTPNDTLEVAGANAFIRVNRTAAEPGITFRYSNSSTNRGDIAVTSAGAMYFTAGGSTEKMRIDSSGNLLVGTTSTIGGATGVLQVKGTASQNAMQVQIGTNGNNGILWYNASASAIGSIVVNSGTVAYNTSSDYRMKENIAPMTGALTAVLQLKPCTYTWKEDGKAGQGFIAHELQTVVPDCVTGEKDAVDADGNPKYQGIDTSFLVATLTAAIQEQQALIESLTTRLTALENK